MANHAVFAIICRRNTNDEDEYLMVSSKKPRGKWTGLYYPPGGHMELGESEEQALRRELKEELDITIRPIEKVAQTGSDAPNQISHWWRCEIASGIVRIMEDILIDVCWMTLKEIRVSSRVYPATQKFFSLYF